MAYSSDLSDAEWEIVEPLLLELLPKKKKTRLPKWTNHEWHLVSTQKWL